MKSRFAILTTIAVLALQQSSADRVRQFINDLLAVLDAKPATILSPTADLQAALNTALPGDRITLPAGATYVGNFVLPRKDGDSPIIIATAGTLPDVHSRIGPANVDQLATLQSPNSQPALATAAAAHSYIVIGLQFACDGGDTCVALGDGSSAQSTLASVPHDLILDRVYVHGSPDRGEKRCISLNSAATTVTNSYVSDCKSVGQDSQAIGGWNGPGPFEITNNYLDGAGENVIFGGGDPPIPNLVPCDITIRDNSVNKPAALRNSVWQVKNLLELKNACRVTIDHNTLTNNWSAAQVGYAVLFTPRNQDGACPWCGVRDVSFTNNAIRHVAGGISILGVDNNHPSQQTTNLSILNNLIEDLDPVAYKNQQTGDVGTGRALAIVGGPQRIEIAHLTVTGLHMNSWLTIGDAAVPGLIIRDSLMDEGDYGLKVNDGGMGLAALLLQSPGSLLRRNVITHQTPDSFIVYGPDNARVPDATIPSPWPTTDNLPVGADRTKIPQ